MDGQNAYYEKHRNMAFDFEDSVAFQSACDLVFSCLARPNAYAEPKLRASRRDATEGAGA